MELQYMYWFGVVFSVVGVLSILGLGRIFYKFHDMYPWFGGLQPWITGYYLLPVGVYLLSTRWMFMNDIISYNFTLVDSGILVVWLLVLFVLSAIVQHYLKKVMVVAGQIESDQEKLPDKE